ncbi:MAG: RNA polymerase subunit sigma-54, partial [Clostridium sp.]
FYNRDIRSQDTVGIILSHGYSTASSIADAANSLLNSYTFEAIDMPLNTPVQEISGKLNDFIEENPHLKNIILLVDMGSLEGIGEVIADSVNVGVINKSQPHLP